VTIIASSEQLKSGVCVALILSTAASLTFSACFSSSASSAYAAQIRPRKSAVSTAPSSDNASSKITGAVDSLKKAAAGGDPHAQTKLGTLYMKGFGVSKNLKKAAELYDNAARHGSASAQFHLAAMYEKGEGISRDLNKAIKLYQQAADGGNVFAQCYLGFLPER